MLDEKCIVVASNYDDNIVESNVLLLFDIYSGLFGLFVWFIIFPSFINIFAMLNALNAQSGNRFG